MAVVDQHDEVGQILAGFRAETVGHLEAEVVVLHVGSDLRVRLGDAAELGLPIAIENHPIDVAATGAGLPAIGFRGSEVDVTGGACGIVGIEQRLDGTFADRTSA